MWSVKKSFKMEIVPSLRWYGNGPGKDTTTNRDDGSRTSTSMTMRNGIGSFQVWCLGETECWKPFDSSEQHKHLSNDTSKSSEKPILLTLHGRCISRSASG